MDGILAVDHMTEGIKLLIFGMGSTVLVGTKTAVRRPSVRQWKRRVTRRNGWHGAGLESLYSDLGITEKRSLFSSKRRADISALLTNRCGDL